MLVLSIRTDKPDAELGLYEDAKQLDYEVWQAHRALAETLHRKIEELLGRNGKTLKDIEGIVAYKGPGSFTGLRIGLSVVNALAYGLPAPIIGIEGETSWIEKGLAALMGGQSDEMVIPEYGSPVHITAPAK